MKMRMYFFLSSFFLRLDEISDLLVDWRYLVDGRQILEGAFKLPRRLPRLFNTSSESYFGLSYCGILAALISEIFFTQIYRQSSPLSGPVLDRVEQELSKLVRAPW